MNIFKLLVLVCLVLTRLSSVMAVERQSYKPLAELPSFLNSILKATNDVRQVNGAIPKEKLDGLIRSDINMDWPTAPPIKEIKTIKPFSPINYAEGTGTRGGGSGLVVRTRDGFSEVKLLEIFRSENVQRYNLFFPVDDELKKMEDQVALETAAQMIFETVLGRISQVVPGLASKIEKLYKVELPFKNWIPVVQDLPAVADEVEYPLEPNKEKVQIAVRRTKHIVYNVRAYAAMSPLNRAALWMHEYIYALSGLENSSKTQRTVSLFFSSDFLTIVANELKLTQLFFELDLLAISRKSIAGSLPPGAQLASQKQTENCGLMARIKGAAPGENVDVGIQINGAMKTLSLTRSQAVIVFSSLNWSKSFLEKSFPIYKFSGQKIMADRLCLNSKHTKITQIQSALAIDEDMHNVTERVALTESQLFKAQSDLIEATIKYQENPNLEDRAPLSQAFQRVSDVRLKLFTEEMEFSRIAVTAFEKIVNPRTLGEYNIAIEY